MLMWNAIPIIFLMQVIIPISISRVNQFDAARLDVEMSAMLKEQLVKVFSLMKVLSLSTLEIFVLLPVLMLFLHISQDSCSNMSLNLMLSSSSSSGDSQFGLTSQPQAMH